MSLPQNDDAARETVVESFRRFDADGSGAIGREELAQVLKAGFQNAKVTCPKLRGYCSVLTWLDSKSNTTPKQCHFRSDQKIVPVFRIFFLDESLKHNSHPMPLKRRETCHFRDSILGFDSPFSPVCQGLGRALEPRVGGWTLSSSRCQWRWAAAIWGARSRMERDGPLKKDEKGGYLPPKERTPMVGTNLCQGWTYLNNASMMFDCNSCDSFESPWHLKIPPAANHRSHWFFVTRWTHPTAPNC